MAKAKCENCDDESKVLLEIWLPIQKRWGEEWIKKKVCPACWETIVAIDLSGDEEIDESIKYKLDANQREYICVYCCNYKECPEDCPLKEKQKEYELNQLDAEDLCSHCKHNKSKCDKLCPIRKKEETQKQ